MHTKYAAITSASARKIGEDDTMLVKCWVRVEDAGQTFKQH